VKDEIKIALLFGELIAEQVPQMLLFMVKCFIFKAVSPSSVFWAFLLMYWALLRKFHFLPQS